MSRQTALFRRCELLRLLLFSLAVLAEAGSRRACAQGAVDGGLRGVVRDAAGGPVRGAAVELRDRATGAHVLLQTDTHGEFFAAHLQPGRFVIRVGVPGLAAAVQEAAVAVGEVSTVSVRLGRDATPRGESPGAPPQVTEEVSVSADEDGPEAATSASVVSSTALRELPLEDRRWQSLALLLPSVNAAGEDADGTGLLSFRGLAPTQNSLVLDGVSGDQSYSGTPAGSGADAPAEPDADAEAETLRSFAQGSGRGTHPGAAYVVSEAAVREFRVTGQNGSALNGHAAGGVITAVTRSGGDAVHGNAFFLVRESAWAATNPYSTVTRFRDGVVTTTSAKPHDLRQQFGGALGGPLRRDRLFFFAASDWQRRGFPAVSSPQDPNFYGLTAIQTALLGHRGVRSTQIAAALNYLDRLTGPVERRADQNVNFLKLDWQARDQQRLSLQGNRARSSSPAGLRTAPVVNRGRASFGNSVVQVDSVVARWTSATSAGFGNEVRLQVGRDLHREEPQTPLAEEPAISVGGLAPEVAIGPGGLSFGTPASVAQGPSPEERRVQVAEVATLALGRHLIQMGADLSLVHDRVEQLSNAEGTFRYDSGVTGGHAGGLVDWITDYSFGVNSYPNGACPSITAPVHYACFRSFTQSFGSRGTVFATAESAGFVQDDWRVRPGLTLGLGLRYEYELLPKPQQPNTSLDGIFGARGATSVFPEDRNNFGPRVSVAWEPLGEHRGTVRLGYGLYYGRVPGATVRSALVETAMPSSVTRIRLVPTTITDCPQAGGQGFGYPCAYVAAPPTGITTTTSATIFDRRFRTPMLQQGTLALERELHRGWTASASYLVNLNRQLPNSVDINIAPATQTRSFALQGGTGQPGVRDGETFSLPLYTQRLTTRFGPVTAIRSDANGTYHALVLEVHGRSRSGLELRASWTWSKAIDFGQNAGAVPPVDGQLDPYALGYDKAVSSLNYPHRIVVSGVWSPAARGAGRWERRLANGWSVGAIAAEASGRPYSLNIFGGTRLSGGQESLNGSGGLAYLPTVGRNTLRLPDTANLDARVSRAVPLHGPLGRERAQLRVFAEVFNVANHRNISSVSERAFLVGSEANGVTPLLFQDAAAVAAEGLNVRPFGTRTEAAAGSLQERQVQLGLRVEF